jgi:hypothetical protein
MASATTTTKKARTKTKTQPPATKPSGGKTRSTERDARSEGDGPRAILAIDVGGTSVKALASGQHEPLKIDSGKDMTPARMVEAVMSAAKPWKFDAVSIGYPGLVGAHGPHSEPLNLGPGWVGFDFAAAFGKPVKIMNDAAMQALGSYNGGRMLFLGLGTGLGSTLITQNVIIPLELGELLHRGDDRLGLLVGRRGLKRIGKSEWRRIVREMVDSFARAFVVDYVVLGGGNAKLLKELPGGARLGHNLTAFRGGFRLWHLEEIPTHSPQGEEVLDESRKSADWRVI